MSCKQQPDGSNNNAVDNSYKFKQNSLADYCKIPV